MGAIVDRARQALAQRLPVGSLNLATGQVEHRAADATDVAGMLEPGYKATEELEDKLESELAKLRHYAMTLEARIAMLEVGQ